MAEVLGEKGEKAGGVAGVGVEGVDAGAALGGERNNFV